MLKETWISWPRTLEPWNLEPDASGVRWGTQPHLIRFIRGILAVPGHRQVTAPWAAAPWEVAMASVTAAGLLGVRAPG